MKQKQCICQSIHSRQIPAPVVPPGFTVKSWVQYINSYIDMRVKGLIDKLERGIDEEDPPSIIPDESPTPSIDEDAVREIVNEPRDFVRLRDINNPNNIYQVFIQDGIVYSEKEDSQ